MFFRSRVDATHARIIGHTVYRQHVCCGPCVHGVSVCITTQIVETRDHFVLQSLVNYVLSPEVAHTVLNPLKIRNRHTAGVGQNVGNYKDALLMEDFVSRRGRRTIGPFGEHLALEPIGVLGRYLIFGSRRNQHVAFQVPAVRCL